MNHSRIESKRAFTMIEMLVVLGIIAILAGATFIGVGAMVRKAQRAQAQELVSNTATALSTILQTRRSWPRVLLENSGGQMDESVAAAFIPLKLMGVKYDAEKYNNGEELKNCLVGTDRCGIVDPWAVAVLKKNKSNTRSTAVPSGKTVKDHTLWYAIDKDGDGVITKSEGAPGAEVRATAIVWCAGADGEMGGIRERGNKKAADDVYSWSRNQEDNK